MQAVVHAVTRPGSGKTVVGNAMTAAERKKSLFQPHVPNMSEKNAQVVGPASMPSVSFASVESERDKRLQERSNQRQKMVNPPNSVIYSAASNEKPMPNSQPSDSKSRRDQIWEEKRKKFVEKGGGIAPENGGNFSGMDARHINTDSHFYEDTTSSSFVDSNEYYRSEPSFSSHASSITNSNRNLNVINESDSSISQDYNQNSENSDYLRKQEYALALKNQMQDKQNRLKAEKTASSYVETFLPEDNRHKHEYAAALELQIKEKEIRKKEQQASLLNEKRSLNSLSNISRIDDTEKKRIEYANALKAQVREKEERKLIEKAQRLAPQHIPNESKSTLIPNGYPIVYPQMNSNYASNFGPQSDLSSINAHPQANVSNFISPSYPPSYPSLPQQIYQPSMNNYPSNNNSAQNSWFPPAEINPGNNYSNSYFPSSNVFFSFDIF